MLGKRPSGPMIGKLSELLISGGGCAAAFLDAAGSPRGPLNPKAQQSPRGLKGYNLGGVGLGIVVALDRGGSEVLPKHAVCVPNLNRSGPIPVVTNEDGRREVEGGSLEDYTYVTCHVPNKTFTKVYYNGGVVNEGGVPIRTQAAAEIEAPEASFPTSNFLSSCHLCRKELDGKDIYMYRGEKAFCSAECRSRQIVMDERKERCRSEASRSQVELSSSPYTTREHIFSTGILAL